MVILYDDMPAIEVGVEFLQTEAYWKTLLLNICLVSLNVNKGFNGKSYGATALYEGSFISYSLVSICPMKGFDLS